MQAKQRNWLKCYSKRVMHISVLMMRTQPMTGISRDVPAARLRHYRNHIVSRCAVD